MATKPFILACLIFLNHGYANAKAPSKHQSNAVQQLQMSRSVAGQRLEYLLYHPVKSQMATKRPVVLFLHGAGERGLNISDTIVHGPIKHRHDNKELLGSYILVPQCPTDGWWQPTTLMRLLETVINDPRHHIDADRIYVTGLSMGGYGTWNLIARYPNFFAAAVPVCGGGKIDSLTITLKINGPPQFNKSDMSVARNVSVWAFHGDRDKAVPYTQSLTLTRLLKDAGNPNVKLTIYEGVGHDAWSPTYANPELYGWMFKQRRSTVREPPTPTPPEQQPRK
jgi:predicted peptidase